jgi:hypothetical protein
MKRWNKYRDAPTEHREAHDELVGLQQPLLVEQPQSSVTPAHHPGVRDADENIDRAENGELAQKRVLLALERGGGRRARAGAVAEWGWAARGGRVGGANRRSAQWAEEAPRPKPRTRLAAAPRIVHDGAVVRPPPKKFVPDRGCVLERA